MSAVAPPGRIAVRLRAMTQRVHPFHSTNATLSTPPIHRATELSVEIGSPSAAVSTSPTASGMPRATGGRIRNAGESTGAIVSRRSTRRQGGPRRPELGSARRGASGSAGRIIPAGRRWRQGQLHRDAESSSSTGTEGKGAVVCLRDALDDREAQADTCVVRAYAVGAAPKRLAEGGEQLWGQVAAGVLHGEGNRLGVDRGREPHCAPFGQVVDDRVVHEVGRHLQQERVGADGGGDVA